MSLSELEKKFRDSESHKARYQRRKAQHCCIQCGKQDARTLQGQIYCAACHDKRWKKHVKYKTERKDEIRAREKADREFLRENSLCIRCRSKDSYTLAGRALCAECAKFERERAKARRERDPAAHAERCRKYRQLMIDKGLCTRCGRKLQDLKHKECEQCRNIRRIQQEKYRRRKNPDTIRPRGSFGVCSMCNKNMAIPGKKVCPECREILLKNLKKCNAAHGPISSHVRERFNAATFRGE